MTTTHPKPEDDLLLIPPQMRRTGPVPKAVKPRRRAKQRFILPATKPVRPSGARWKDARIVTVFGDGCYQREVWAKVGRKWCYLAATSGNKKRRITRKQFDVMQSPAGAEQ